MGNFFHTPIEVLDIAGIGLGSDGFQELQSLIKEEIKLVKINIRSIFVLNVLFCFNVMLQVTKKKKSENQRIILNLLFKSKNENEKILLLEMLV